VTKPFYKKEWLERLYVLREIEAKSPKEALQIWQSEFKEVKGRDVHIKLVYDLVNRFKGRIKKEMHRRAKVLVEEEHMKLSAIPQVLAKEFALYKKLIPSVQELKEGIKESAKKPPQPKAEPKKVPSRKLTIRKGETQVEVELSEAATLEYLRGLTSG